MIEVETKVRIGNLKDIKRKVSQIAKYVGRQKKIDDYYTLQEKGYPKKSLRVRRRGRIYEVNFKQSLNYVHGVHAKNETEFRVSDISGFLNLIADFGFKKWLRKEKVSEVYKIGERFHIEINEVKGLGAFLEVEYLAKPNEVANARKKVLDVLKKLGVEEKEIVRDGYTKMLWGKRS